MIMFRRRAAMLLPLSLLLVAGCASGGERGDAAAIVAMRMLSAVEGQDGAGACAELVPDTAAALEESAGKPCPERFR